MLPYPSPDITFHATNTALWQRHAHAHRVPQQLDDMSIDAPRPIRVLVIDDDPDALALLKLRLEQTGRFSVTTAQGGTLGLETARDLEPDVIVCDIYMPHMSGPDVATAIAADDVLNGVPLLFLSALVKPDEVREHGGRIGGWPMASKEEPIHSIVRRIDTLLQRHRR